MQGSQGVKAYRTIERASEIELVIQKSRFIGRCFPVGGEADAAAVLEDVRKRHWDASHNCYAFRIGTGGMLSRSSDDGEPSGTAGAPILNVLARMELCNVLCVVTRYFGGILLGAGGLIRAYSSAASDAARAAGIAEMRPCTRLCLELGYADWAAAENVILKLGDVADVAYSDAVAASLWTPDTETERVCARLVDITGGRVKIQPCEYAMRARTVGED